MILFSPYSHPESFKILKAIYQVDDQSYERNLGTFNDLVNLEALYSKSVRTLSLGQRTLCDIAAAFLHSPKIVFLDEPTIGLDISIKSKIRALIRELNQAYRGNSNIAATKYNFVWIWLNYLPLVSPSPLGR